MGEFKALLFIALLGRSRLKECMLVDELPSGEFPVAMAATESWITWNLPVKSDTYYFCLYVIGQNMPLKSRAGQ